MEAGPTSIHPSESAWTVRRGKWGGLKNLKSPRFGSLFWAMQK